MDNDKINNVILETLNTLKHFQKMFRSIGRVDYELDITSEKLEELINSLSLTYNYLNDKGGI